MLQKIVWFTVICIILFMASNLSSIEKAELSRIIARQDERIRNIERMLQGQPISTVRIADAAITTAKVGSLSADKITTGTLTVKDGLEKANISVLDALDNEIVLVDSNGVQVKDTLGNAIVTLDEDGLLVNDGNIVVKNGDGDTVFDVKGLVGNNNFTFDTTYTSSNQTTDSTSLIDATNSSLSFSLTRTTKVMFLLTATGHSTDGKGIGIVINVDGTDYDVGVHVQQSFTFGGMQVGSSAHLILSLGSGNHTAKIRWCVRDAAGMGNLNGRRLSYLILGK